MKLHFIASILTTALFTITVVQESLTVRILLLIPDLILMYVTIFLFAIDYDKMYMYELKKEERKSKKVKNTQKNKKTFK